MRHWPAVAAGIRVSQTVVGRTDAGVGWFPMKYGDFAISKRLAMRMIFVTRAVVRVVTCMAAQRAISPKAALNGRRAR